MALTRRCNRQSPAGFAHPPAPAAERDRYETGLPPFSRTLTIKPIEVLKSVYVKAKKVQRGVHACPLMIRAQHHPAEMARTERYPAPERPPSGCYGIRPAAAAVPRPAGSRHPDAAAGAGNP